MRQSSIGTRIEYQWLNQLFPMQSSKRNVKPLGPALEGAQYAPNGDLYLDTSADVWVRGKYPVSIL